MADDTQLLSQEIAGGDSSGAVEQEALGSGETASESAPAAGASETAAVAGTVQDADAPKPFYSRGGKDFASADELTAHLDELDRTAPQDRMNHESYQRLTGKYNESKRQLDAAVAKHQQELASFQGERATLGAIRELWTKHPKVAQQVFDMVKATGVKMTPVDHQAGMREQLLLEADRRAEARYGPLLQERQRQQEDAVIDEIIGNKTDYPNGVNRDAVRAALDNLDGISEHDDVGYFKALIALAAKANMNPAEAAAAAAAAGEQEADGSMMPAGSGPTASTAPRGRPLSLAESMAKANAEWRVPA